ncbi:MAG: redox-regulated ATPase YchF [Planctomycetes bacterium]|nr:redox-regulated ATPase YchF [Planctomycetota bacterium]
MKIVIVGFPFSGRTSLFTAISGLSGDNISRTAENVAAVKVPEPRLAWLAEHFKPRKYTEAVITFVDLPGSVEGESEHAGLTRHLPTLRQADALLLVLRGFESDSVPAHKDRIDPAADLAMLRDEMLLADLEICDERVKKLEKAVTRPSKTREHDAHELKLLRQCREALEAEKPLATIIQPGEEEKMLRGFGFLTQKRSICAVNVGEKGIGVEPPLVDEHSLVTFAVCASVEADIIELSAEERPEFMADYNITVLARDRMIQASLDALGMISFYTVGEDEVRAWPIPRGTPAVEAAGKIHSDLERGFIRAEVVSYEDFHAAGDMRAAKTAGKVRQEHKGYVVQDGDIINIKFNV